MTMRAASVLVLVGLASLVVSCKLPKKDADVADAAAEAAATLLEPAPAPAEREAKNAEQLTRFPDETKLASEPAKLERAVTSVREDPPNGKVFAVLPKGTDVVKIAQHQGSVLIQFTSPTDTKEMLAGWVAKDAFVAAPATTTPAKPVPAAKCAAGETLLWGDPPFCEKVCTAGSDCATGELCLGVAPVLMNKLPGKAVKFCVGENHAAAKDAGAPAAIADAAGAAPVAASDAGAGTGTGTDAGASAGASKPTLAELVAIKPRDAGAVIQTLEKPPCREGRVLVEQWCRIPCSQDTECPKNPPSACTAMGATKVCKKLK